MARRRAKVSTAAPWGRLAGLLCGAISTLIGVMAGLDPHVILQRAIVAATIVGLFTCGIRGVMRSLIAGTR
jgi:VIT1/CCC1 family predicted Fe2+/Mn2+ transporter